MIRFRLSLQRFSLLSSLIVSSIIFCSSPASAQSLIRDAEIEHTLRTFGDPIFSAAGLTPENVHLFIVNSDSVNAFVAGGSNMFIHTGLIDACTGPDMLIGVMAHETGHIAGGHLARGAENLRDAQMGMILGYVLGVAAAAAGGGEAGMAVLTGTQSVLGRSVLAFSRTQEQAADQAGLSYLDKTGISASGMLSMFNILRRKESSRVGSIDPYAITHPLSKERIEVVRNHVERSGIAEGAYPKAYDEPFQRMRAKLYAFIQMPPRTFARYAQNDRSVAARMARAIAWYKIPEIDKALAEMNSLIAERPNDAFLHDLKGQILYENGHISEARKAYERASALMPDSALILTSLGEARIASGETAQLKNAVTDLEKAHTLDNTNPRTWRLLATAYGKLGNNGMANLSLAEEAMLNNKPDIARRQAEQALITLPQGTPARLRAEDIKQQAAEMKRREKEDA